MECSGDLQDCDSDPSDCETDISSDPAHCGGCDDPCPREHDECIDSQCVTPCNELTATLMVEENIDYPVAGDGCLRIAEHPNGFFQLLASRVVPFTYEDDCGNTGEGEIPANQGSDLIPACPMTITLMSTSPEVRVRWWNQGG